MTGHPTFFLACLALACSSRMAVGQDKSTAAVDIGPRVLVSADLPGIHHAEPHLAIDPTDPDHLLAAVKSCYRIPPAIGGDGGFRLLWADAAEGILRLWFAPLSVSAAG